MDFRNYDNALGRFNVIDPLAELSYSQTPYHFGNNTPVYFSDPSGLFPSWDAAIEYALSHGGGDIKFTNGVYSVASYEDGGASDLWTSKVNGELVYAIVGRGKGGGVSGDAGMSSSEIIGSLIGAYSDFGHDHKFYTTTAGILKPIYKTNGAVRSSRAANFASLSSKIKFAGFTAGALGTAMSYEKIYDNKAAPIDYADASIGTIGLAETGASYFAGVEIPYVGEGVAVYGIVRFSYDLGYNYGPSHWYGSDNTSWFK